MPRGWLCRRKFALFAPSDLTRLSHLQSSRRSVVKNSHPSGNAHIGLVLGGPVCRVSSAGFGGCGPCPRTTSSPFALVASSRLGVVWREPGRRPRRDLGCLNRKLSLSGGSAHEDCAGMGWHQCARFRQEKCVKQFLSRTRLLCLALTEVVAPVVASRTPSPEMRVFLRKWKY